MKQVIEIIKIDECEAFAKVNLELVIVQEDREKMIKDIESIVEKYRI
jgi:4-diphosphocytidyl-2C-methyl-D-erythritol kinase